MAPRWWRRPTRRRRSRPTTLTGTKGEPIESATDLITTFGLPIFLILLGWIAGRTAEHRHLRSLERRERELSYMVVTDIKTFPALGDPQKYATLVTGEAVIATDYLKSFLAGLRKLVGGELGSYQSLMTRARREAVLRMLEAARRHGYNAVCNLRLNSADIGGMAGRKGVAMVEVFATGTAYHAATGSQS